MGKRRKTLGERRRESEEADQQAWATFYPRLQAIGSLREALLLAAATVAPGRPGRRYFSNLAFFLQSYAPPAGANALELNEYLRLLRAFNAEGALHPGAVEEVEGALLAAITRRFQ